VTAVLRDELDRSLRRHADSVALELGDRSLLFRDVDRWATAIARQLQSRGIGVGDVVALYMHNRLEFVVAGVAVARLGAVKLPINAMLPGATVQDILGRAGTAALIVGDADLIAIAARLPRLDALTVLQADGRLLPGAEPLVALPVAAEPSLDYDALPVRPDDPAALYFTGGTTGKPKGVLHSQASTVALHIAQLLEAEIHQGERLLLMTPLAHAAGLFVDSALIRGATSILTEGFDAAGAARMLTVDGVTWTFLVPTMIYRLLDAMTDLGAPATELRTIVYGAAPITPGRLEAAMRMFGPVFVQLYGQTECPNWGTRLAKDDHDLARPHLLGSCGQASIRTEVRIVDAGGDDVPAGVAGEICLRSPYTLDAYLGDPVATAAKFLGDWIRTGDIGVMDDAGYVYLRDRKNDMVISGGMNVYCREVEDVLAEHPGVLAVAVIGVPHDDWGEAVHAIVVPSGLAAEFDSDALLEWVRGRVAGYARPKSVEVVDALPETPVGKIDKKALREPHWDNRDRAIG
jgi:fatty-acyl-CoA synthase/long-chain acyl-CoA synthetase